MVAAAWLSGYATRRRETGAQLSYMKGSYDGRCKGYLTGEEAQLGGEVGDSELWHNNGSCAPPPATKAQVRVRVRSAQRIEAKWQKGSPQRRPWR
jgi:hypothetical protein